MNPPPSSQTPARVRWRWRWGRIVLLGLVAGIGALGWNQYTWQRAVRQLEEAGITADAHEPLGERVWRIAQADWRQLFKAGTWRTPPIVWRRAYGKARQLRNLDALAPALRRINPEDLVLSYCPVLQNVDGLKGLTALQWLNLDGCPALQNIDVLKGLTTLERLDLSDCPALQNVGVLTGLTALVQLDLRECHALQNVDGLKGLPALQALDLFGCAALQDVDGLKGLPALLFVDLSGCTKLPPEQVAALRVALPKTFIKYP